MASSKIRDTIECSGSVAVTDKIRAKANFTRTQNILLSLIHDDSSSRCQVIEARGQGRLFGNSVRYTLQLFGLLYWTKGA